MHDSSSRPTGWFGFFCSCSGPSQDRGYAPSTLDDASPSINPFASDDDSDDDDTDQFIGGDDSP